MRKYCNLKAVDKIQDNTLHFLKCNEKLVMIRSSGTGP